MRGGGAPRGGSLSAGAHPPRIPERQVGALPQPLSSPAARGRRRGVVGVGAPGPGSSRASPAAPRRSGPLLQLQLQLLLRSRSHSPPAGLASSAPVAPALRRAAPGWMPGASGPTGGRVSRTRAVFGLQTRACLLSRERANQNTSESRQNTSVAPPAPKRRVGREGCRSLTWTCVCVRKPAMPSPRPVACAAASSAIIAMKRTSGVPP